MRFADFEKVKKLLEEHNGIKEALKAEHIGVAYYGDSLLSSISPCTLQPDDDRTEELIRQAIKKRYDEITVELKELGLED